MMNFEQFAERHVHPVATQLVIDSEELRKEGAIGECALRVAAQVWQNNTGLTTASCLRAVSEEAYRYLALRYLEK